jgi:excisionase family DNA binding protein
VSTPKHVARERLVRLGIVPRGLSVDEAAAYVGLARAAFNKEVKEGRLPGPVALGSRRRVWDRAALDRALDGNRAGTGDPIMDAIDARRAS